MGKKKTHETSRRLENPRHFIEVAEDRISNSTTVATLSNDSQKTCCYIEFYQKDCFYLLIRNIIEWKITNDHSDFDSRKKLAISNSC